MYPRLATYSYCPPKADEILYMATIQNHQKILEPLDEAERLTLALAAGYRDYIILDGSGKVDTQRGVRLGGEQQRLKMYSNVVKEALFAPVLLLTF